MITASIMDDVITAVWNRVLDAVAVLDDFVFIGELWLVVVLLGAVLTVVCIYLPWQWLRSALGFLLALAIAGAAGATAMWKRMRSETKPLRDKVNQLEAEKRKEGGGNRWF